MENLLWLLIIGFAGYWVYQKTLNKGGSSGKLEQSDAILIATYTERMKIFREIVLGYISENFHPIDKLPYEYSDLIQRYLVGASCAACKDVGVGDDMVDSMNRALLDHLKNLGFRDKGSDSPVHPIFELEQRKCDDLTFGAGADGYMAWIKESESAAQSQLQNTLSVWMSFDVAKKQSNTTITDVPAIKS